METIILFFLKKTKKSSSWVQEQRKFYEYISQIEILMADSYVRVALAMALVNHHNCKAKNVNVSAVRRATLQAASVYNGSS